MKTPMRLAILSDAHANREALARVLSRSEELGIESLFYLGDLVGYNADPDFCVEEILARAHKVVRGNHDKAVAHLADVDNFNPNALQAVLWTRRELSGPNRRRLGSVARGPLVAAGRYLICHGSPLDEDQYIYDRRVAGACFHFLEAEFPRIRLCFFGHTHIPMIISVQGAAYSPPKDVPQRIDPEVLTMINPGSVGQPRDGIPSAAFGVYDDRMRTYTQYRIDYPLEETQRKISAAGLPPALADRLGRGR